MSPTPVAIGIDVAKATRIGKTKANLAPSPRGRNPRKRPWSIPALPAGGRPSLAAMAAPPACSSGLP
jgi:hypothetical protein